MTGDSTGNDVNEGKRMKNGKPENHSGEYGRTNKSKCDNQRNLDDQESACRNSEGLHVKFPVKLSDFNLNWNVWTNFSKSSQ